MRGERLMFDSTFEAVGSVPTVFQLRPGLVTDAWASVRECHQNPMEPCGVNTRVSVEVTPIRRTTIVAALSLGTLVSAVAAGYVGFEATIGGTWSHNRAMNACAATPSPIGISNRAAGVSVRDTWTWWLPGKSHVCVYTMKDGTKVVDPVPPGR